MAHSSVAKRTTSLFALGLAWIVLECGIPVTFVQADGLITLNNITVNAAVLGTAMNDLQQAVQLMSNATGIANSNGNGTVSAETAGQIGKLLGGVITNVAGVLTNLLGSTGTNLLNGVLGGLLNGVLGSSGGGLLGGVLGGLLGGLGR